MSFGGYERNIYGATPVEILHAILLGLCEYISEGIDLIFTHLSLDLISHVYLGIYKHSKRQNECNIPDIGPFKNGLNSLTSLKAKERFARIYCTYLAFCNSYLIKNLLGKTRRRIPSQEDTSLVTSSLLLSLQSVLHDIICFHLWLKQEEFKKINFVVGRRKTDSRASRRILF